MLTKFIHSGLLALALLCSGAQAADANAPQTATQGFVFASTPGASGRDILVLQSVATKEDYRLEAFAAQDGKALGKFMPPGEYTVFAARAQKLPKTYPPVTVVAGRLTDLGALLFVDEGDGKAVLLSTRNADSTRNAQAALTQLAAPFAGSEPVEWHMDKVPEPMIWRDTRAGVLTDLQKQHEIRTPNAVPVFQRMRETTAIDTFLSLAKTAAAPATGKVVQDAHGRMYFGAALGQLRVRDANGTWSAIDTGCLHPVTAVEVWGEQLLAGFDNGDVRRSVDGGKTWTVVASLERRTPVIDLSRFADQWFVATARPKMLRNGMRSLEQVSVYSALKDDLSDIVKNRDLPVESEPLVLANARVFKGYYYVNAFPKLWRLDAATMQWRTVSPDTEVHGFQVGADNGTLAAYRIKGGFSKLFVSADHGETWSKYDNPPYVIMDIRFTTPTQGQAVRWNMGAFSSTIELLEYDRAKDAWTKTVEAPAGCNLAFADASQTVKLCVTPGGNILSYADRKWGVEFAAD